MSRRKQSNPRPVLKGNSNEDVAEIARSHSLPSNILHLVSTEEGDISVRSISTILAGSQFGPYRCSYQESNPDTTAQPDFEFTTSKGDKFRVNVEEAGGHWLSLVKQSETEESRDLHNCTILYQDLKIYCTIDKNILPDMELVSKLQPIESRHVSSEDTNTTQPSPLPNFNTNDAQEKVRQSKNSVDKILIQADNMKQEKMEMPNIVYESNKNSFSLIHLCVYCGVRFSSPRTLQAHLISYCSKKPSLTQNEPMPPAEVQNRIVKRSRRMTSNEGPRPKSLQVESDSGTMGRQHSPLTFDKRFYGPDKHLDFHFPSSSSDTQHVSALLSSINQLHYPPSNGILPTPLFSHFLPPPHFIPSLFFGNSALKTSGPHTVLSSADQSEVKSARSVEEPSKRSELESPLDLTTRRDSVSDASDEKKDSSQSRSSNSNASINSTSPSGSSTFKRSSTFDDRETTFPFIKNVPTNVSRCVECNIVFYKYENFLAHKKHYCSSRRTDDKDDTAKKLTLVKRTAVVKATVETRDKSPKEKNVELVATIDEGVLQYYCISCKIKFSSLNTLKAHKKYYCPSSSTTSEDLEGLPADVKMDESTTKVKRETAEVDESNVCVKCSATFNTSQLLHRCAAATMLGYQMPACPYCDYVAQSDSRLVEHVKSHAPTRSFRCTLCGYKGNTVRGMRMHGKMHNDSGEMFTDEHMLEYEEPPQLPKKNKMEDTPRRIISNNGINSLADLELIRMKNEPYKRRRSRKAFEKFENVKSLVPRTKCSVCGYEVDDDQIMGLHMRTHREAETVDFIPDVYHDSINGKHLKVEPNTFHLDGLSSPITSSPITPTSKLEIPVEEIPNDPTDTKSTCVAQFIKEEPADEDSGSATVEVKFADEKVKSEISQDSKYCEQCDIHFLYTSTYVAHKKYYCNSHAGEKANQKLWKGCNKNVQLIAN